MSKKVQFNPSTGKVLYNAVTAKVHVVTIPQDGATCNICGLFRTPLFIDVTLSGITFVQNGVCQDCPAFEVDQSWAGSFDPNGTYRLKQSTGNSCGYELNVPVNITRTRYTTVDGSCGGSTSTVTWTSMLLSAGTLSAGTTFVTFQGSSGSSFINYFDVLFGVNDGTSCLDGTFSNNNTSLTPCQNGAPTDTARIGWGGTATVAEI